MVVVACNLQGEPIAHNQLSGSVRFRSMSDTAELPVAVFRAIPGTTGQALPSPEQLSLDGVEYAVPGNRQVLDFYAAGATPIPSRRCGPNQWCLWILISADEYRTPNTQLRFEIWNERSGSREPPASKAWAGLIWPT